MTGLFLVASLFWLCPAISHTLDIPLQSAVLIRGKPVGFTTSTHQQKRSETFNGTCKEDEYRPRKAKHCCNKCLAGFRVESHCSEEGMKSKCVPCGEGTYSKSPSSSRGCTDCRECLSQFGQVESQRCTIKSDAVCGCPAGRYKSSYSRTFTCLQCSTCENGVKLIPCTADRDTVCICNHGFYNVSNGKCRSCNECNNTDDCKDRCPQPDGSIKSDEPDVVPMILAGVLGAALLAVLIVVIVKNRQKFISTMQTKSPLPATDITGSGHLSAPLMESSTSSGKFDSLLGHEVYVVEDPVLQNKAQNSAPPSITGHYITDQDTMPKQPRSPLQNH